MAFALELELDAEAGRVVRGLWHALSEIGVTWMAESGATPHVSLAIWETIDRPRFEAELAHFAAETGPVAVTFDGVGTFPGGAVFLRLAPNTTLAEMQRQVHARFAALGRSPWQYYLPETWVPHCTLAMEFPRERAPDALAIAKRVSLPIAGRLESVGIVEFRPVRTLARYPLGHWGTTEL